MKKKPFVLGICGKIASGKSAFLQALKADGWIVMDADKVVHALYMAGEVGQRRIYDFFGSEFMKKDGSVDRKKLGAIVFKSPKKLRILNKLIHPLVMTHIAKEISKIDASNKVAIEAVYFDEGALREVVDKVVVISRSVDLIKKTLVNERHIPMKIAEAIIAEQKMPGHFDAKIVNNSTLKAFEKKAIIAAKKLIP